MFWEADFFKTFSLT